jgi:hypothetical protein
MISAVKVGSLGWRSADPMPGSCIHEPRGDDLSTVVVDFRAFPVRTWNGGVSSRIRYSRLCPRGTRRGLAWRAGMARRLTLDFLRTEAASGLILGGAALLAIVAANSPWADRYFGFLAYAVPLQMGQWTETHSVLEWIKEGLMAIFFFVVGLEIKYEILKGELSNPRKLALPVIAAVGGMLAPGVDLPADQRGRGRPAAGLGRAGGDRHRLCPRRAGGGRAGPARQPAHLPAHAGDRR